MRRASLNVAKAFDVLGASKTVDTNLVGYAPVNPVSLTFVRTGATYTQSNEWLLKIGTVLSATGQYSSDTLPSSEQVSFGAQRYQPGNVSGDSGWGASFEVNRPLAIGMTYLKTFTPYVAIDAARVYCMAARRIRGACRRWASAFAYRMRSTTASICPSRVPPAMRRRSKARREARA